MGLTIVCPSDTCVDVDAEALANALVEAGASCFEVPGCCAIMFDGADLPCGLELPFTDHPECAPS